jgi:hypothetical protein
MKYIYLILGICISSFESRRRGGVGGGGANMPNFGGGDVGGDARGGIDFGEGRGGNQMV